MLLRVCLCLTLTLVSAWAQESALIRVGENWRYFKGTQEPSLPPTAWRGTNFDDRGWSNGISGFSNGYGPEYDEPTHLADFSTTYRSLYLRRAFVVTNLAEVKWLVLRVDYNDGFVAFLNGEEIVRRNLAGAPGSLAPFNAYASAHHDRGLTEEIDLTSTISLLRPGTNVLAIQVHGAEPLFQGFSDVTFTILPELLANFTRGPFVQNASTNRVQVIWKTAYPSYARVEYGRTPALGQSVTLDSLVTTHVVTLTNLAANATYFYRVRSQRGDDEVASEIAPFRTLRTSGPVSFVVFGDSGSGHLPQYQIAKQTLKANPDLVMHVGDIVYPVFTTNTVDAKCFGVYYQHMKSTPYFFAVGNHDLYASQSHFADSFYLPTNNVTAPETGEFFYSFDHGDVHFTVLLQPFASQYLLTEGDLQYRWLTNDLAMTRKPWKLVFMHAPMLTSGAHRFDDYGKFGTADRIDIMNVLLPVASRYGVQLVFAGHDHQYEKFNPTNGVHSIVAAGGGGEVRWLTQLDRASSHFSVFHHCVKVSVSGDTLHAQAINPAGEVFDWLTIQRAPPPRRLYHAAWHTPIIEAEAANDTDGNIVGQRFDFVGDPIPTLPGQLSNLGRVYVNNDQTNLYVGFDQSMIYPEQSVFLFIEAPGLSGVTNLVNVGNGIVDPNGQGVDGLDFLQNLAFTNFVPVIGAVLGDEYADGKFRSFARLSSTFNAGQGVFFLDRGLSEVPGVRLQQFNHSPQTGAFPGEENANFIELAIPLRALGTLQPGGVVKIGAVVGLETVDTSPARQAHALDASFLGYSLTGSGLSPARLEGLEVKLALNPSGDQDNDQLSDAEEARLGTDLFNPDTDGDGLPDGWEAAHGLNPIVASAENGADADPDGDGFSNAQERFNGTHPRDAKSAVRLTVEPLGSRRYRFTWSTVSGKHYQLEHTDNLSRSFTNLSPLMPPTAAWSTNQTREIELPLRIGTNDMHQFFRVRSVE